VEGVSLREWELLLSFGTKGLFGLLKVDVRVTSFLVGREEEMTWKLIGFGEVVSTVKVGYTCMRTRSSEEPTVCTWP
jgi:hypothetical protein